MPYLTVGKENSGHIDLYYEDHGTGKPVILIHGWPLSSRSWEKQLPVLLQGGYRVITYDRRGFGNSGKPAFGYDYDTFTEDLHQLITKLDLRDVTLVGFSMGTGEVARYLSKYGSDRIERAAFLASVPPFLLNTPDNPSGVNVNVFDEIKKSITDDRLSFLNVFLSNFYNVDSLGEERISGEVLHYSWNIASLASPIGTMECVNAWLTDFREDLTRIDVPTLIIHGNSDRILPITATGDQLRATLKDSRYVVIEGGPHGLNWTHAEQVNRELLTFLGQSVQPAARGRRAA